MRLKKSKKVLLMVYHRFLKKKSTLTPTDAAELKKVILELDLAIKDRNRDLATSLTVKLEELYTLHLKKSPFERVRDFAMGLVIALLIAVVVRQSWFELYEIPTGSMRPTFKEQDRLSVSKTTYGINVPLTTDHLYFNPSLMQRNGIVIFTVENMDFPNGDTIYFYLFPGKKQLVKRLIGKPGDMLYFYGGKIYGLDAAGNELSQELQLPELDLIDHIPFFPSFEGSRVTTTQSSVPGVFSPVILHLYNIPIAKMAAWGGSQVRSEMLLDVGSRYFELFGMENFAVTRLLSKDDVRRFTNHDLSLIDDAPFYLELKHHPNLESAKMGYDVWNRYRPMLGTSSSLIPLQDKELKTLFSHLYTARFVVKNGIAHRYGLNPSKAVNQSVFPHMPTIPDGMYEFYYGKAYAVKWEGVTSELPASHPLYDLQNLQTLFNNGIEFDTLFSPQIRDQALMPSRYAYFRDGDLYVMGAPLFTKNDLALRQFIEREKTKPLPFIDAGVPSPEKIRKFGLKIPDKSYLVLGDNHSNSGDSRDFGFVPEDNLRGAPSLIFWPPGSRFGAPLQPSYPLLNPGRIAVWILAAIGIFLYTKWNKRRNTIKLD